MENQHDKQISEAIHYANKHYNNPRDNIVSMLNAISELNLMDWVRDFKYSNGSYRDENFLRICNHPYVKPVPHYDFSCEQCLRSCQLILQRPRMLQGGFV